MPELRDQEWCATIQVNFTTRAYAGQDESDVAEQQARAMKHAAQGGFKHINVHHLANNQPPHCPNPKARLVGIDRVDVGKS